MFVDMVNFYENFPGEINIIREANNLVQVPFCLGFLSMAPSSLVWGRRVKEEAVTRASMQSN